MSYPSPLPPKPSCAASNPTVDAIDAATTVARLGVQFDQALGDRTIVNDEDWRADRYLPPPG